MKLSEFFDQPEKWCKRSFENKKGGYCILGAELFLKGSPTFDVNNAEDILKIYDVLPTQFKLKDWGSSLSNCIISFNDDPATTFEDVKALLKKAGV